MEKTKKAKIKQKEKMIKKLLLFFAVLLLGITLATPSYAWHLPDIKTGFAMRTRGNLGITITKSIELYQINFSDWDAEINLGFFKYPIKNLNDIAFDFGIGQDLIFVSLDFILVPIVEISLCAYWGYDFQIRDFQTGLMIQWISW